MRSGSPRSTSEGARPAERRLTRALRTLAALALVGGLACAAAPLLSSLAAAARPLPLVANSAVAAFAVALASLYAAGDPRRSAGLIAIVIAAFALGAAAAGAFLAAGDAGVTVPALGGRVEVGVLLGVSMGASLAVASALLFLLLAARREARGSAGALPSGPPRAHRTAIEALDAAEPPTGPERLLRALAVALGLLLLAAGVGHVAGAFLPAVRAALVHPSFVAGSAMAPATLGLLCLYAVRKPRERQPLLGVAIAGLGAALLTSVWFLALAPDLEAPVAIGSREWPVRRLLALRAAVAGGTGTALLLVYLGAWRARYRLEFLQPIEFRTLAALADVLVMGEDERLGPLDVARNVERHVRAIRARRRWVYRVVLFAVYFHPLLYLKAPLGALDAERRVRHLEQHFYRDVALRLVPDAVRRLVQAAIRIGKQLAYVGYYNDPRTFESVGYVRFTDRPSAPPGLRPSPVSLEVREPAGVEGETIRADICVIGSGAAGAVLAHRLAERTEGTGARILIVERGRYVPPREFSEDEVEMMGKLYADGLFQQTTDFRFTILQGSCVGGSTVVNNAVCFDPPEPALDRWEREHDAGLDRGALHDATRAVRSLLRVQRQDHDRLNPSAPKFVDAARGLEVGPVEANIERCLGCGYCNIGCAYGRKLSMLDLVLPEAQASGRVDILAECEVRRLRTRSGRPLRVENADAVLSDGRHVTIEAEVFALAAGAIASPYLLLRSGIADGLPVGRGMSFNMGSPVTAEFDEVMDAYDGLQISHYGLPGTDRGFVLETWWNPPVAQAVNMPGWFGDHFANMRRYPRLMAVGVLVGTEPSARVRRALTGGPDVSYRPSPGDLRALGDGLALASEILFEAGATRVMLNTWGYDVLTHPDEVSGIHDIVADPSYITLGSGHPQGGLALSRDPARGVVGDDLHVHGYENLYACDASVFPTSLTVNPQLTVMTLARYAADRVSL